MNDTTSETPKLSWWRRLSAGLKRTSGALGTAVADLVTKRKLDRAMLDDIEDVLLRADLGTQVAARIAEAVGAGRYDKAISADEVKAVVALAAGASATEDELIAFCKERLSAYKYPRIIEIIEELPKGPTGKILKRELR